METTEELALEQIGLWAAEFGWKYAVFTQADIWHCLVDMNGDATDEQIKSVMDTRMWRNKLEEAIIREGMECVYDAISDVERVTP